MAIALNAVFIKTEAELISAISASIDFINVVADISLSGNRVISKTLSVHPGCLITTTGYTLTISGSFVCGDYQCFTGTGTVVLPTTLTEAKALWWGTTDVALQAAINASAEAGVPLNIGGSDVTWSLTDGLILPSHSHIYGSATIDSSGDSHSNARTMSASGSIGTSSLCDGNVTERDNSVTVADSSGFAVDDWVLLHSEDKDVLSGDLETAGDFEIGKTYVIYTVGTTDFTLIGASSNTVGVSFVATGVGTGTGKAHYLTYRYRGEYKRIRAKSGNTIYFTSSVLENYTTANSARVSKMNWVEDIVIDGPTLKGKDSEAGGDYGIRLIFCKDVVVRNCTLQGYEIYSLSFENTLNFEAASNTFDGVQYESSSGSIFYGVAVTDGSMYGRVHHNFGQKLRHLVVTTSFGGGSGRFGQPYFITIDHNHMTDAMGETIYASYAYEHHGSGRFTIWDSNIADGCYSGFHVDNGMDVKVVNNVFTNCRIAGITIADTWSNELKNIDISGNTITNGEDHVTVHGIRYMGPPSLVTWCNVVIANNKISTFNTSSDAGIYINSNTDVKSGCVISGNVITSGSLGGQDDNSNFGIYVVSEDWIIKDNLISNMRQGILSNSSGVTGKPNLVFGNVVDFDVQATAGYGISVKGDKTIVKNNVVRRGRYPLYVQSGTTGALVTNNIWYNCASAINDSGTSTVLRDNDTL